MRTVSKTERFSRADRSFLGSWWWTIDHAMLACIFVLALFGVALVSTASPAVAQTLGIDDYHFLKRHLLILLPAFAVMIVISMLSPRQIWRLSSIVLLLGLMAMVAVLFSGLEIKGAQRWLSLFGMSLQPSEFIKPAFIVVVAWLIALKKGAGQRIGTHKPDLNKGAFLKPKGGFSGYTMAIIVYLVTIVLLLMQPDLGMTVVVTCVFASQIFIAGLRFRFMAALLLLGLGGLVVAYFSFHHVQSRVDRFFYPETGDNYQVEQSLNAFKHGGLLGTGPGLGTEKMGLPDAHSDFIFSVAAEEYGLLFVMILMGIFLYILLRGYNRLTGSGDMFSVLAVGGLLTMFGLQALIHMGSAVNLLPPKGMTLPFISYGGSSVLSMGLAMGMVLALTRRRGRTAIARNGLSVRRSTVKQDVEGGAS